LAQTIQVLGNGHALYSIDFNVVDKWCIKSGDESIEVFSLLKEMAHEANKRS